MAFKVFQLSVLLAATLVFLGNEPASGSFLHAKYNFSYAVKDDPSGNDFGHEGVRDFDNTEGSYYVLLPDGRFQRVTYNVNGDSGYVADVTYEGQAQYPQASYKPPQPAYNPPTYA